MKLAIDSYCYNPHFEAADPKKRMTVWDFLKRAKKYGCEGVSLESCFMPPLDDGFLRRLRDKLDEYGLDRVWAWGHPNGLRSGTDRAAEKDLVRHLGHAQYLGAKVMRIVGGSWRLKPKSWGVHKRQLLPVLKRLIGPAEEQGVVMAIENHIDMTSEEMVELITTIDSPWLGVCLDTGNNLRLFEDPVVAAERLAPLARATHIKDIWVLRGNPRTFHFWPSVPLGEGLIDLPRVLGFLRKAKYQGLLAIEVDFLHPDYGPPDRAVEKSVKYLRQLIKQVSGARSTSPQR